MSANENLENLLRTGGLKAEPPDRKECEGLMHSALDRLQDAHSTALSFASRFDLAYNAAHALALTALRLCGYRSDRRYLVFQCLVHTLGLGKLQVRFLRYAMSGAIWLNTKVIWRWMKPCWLS